MTMLKDLITNEKPVVVTLQRIFLDRPPGDNVIEIIHLAPSASSLVSKLNDYLESRTYLFKGKKIDRFDVAVMQNGAIEHSEIFFDNPVTSMQDLTNTLMMTVYDFAMKSESESNFIHNSHEPEKACEDFVEYYDPRLRILLQMSSPSEKVEIECVTLPMGDSERRGKAFNQRLIKYRRSIGKSDYDD